VLTSRHKHVLNRLLAPIAAALARTGVSPSALTLAAPLLTSVACLWLVLTVAILPFCVASLLIGLLDGLDGAVARASGRVTKFGAYLDAVCDRYVESMVAIAVAYVTGYWTLIMVALVGALLVSYSKARAAMEVAVSNQEWPDLMERTERSLLFLGGLSASQLVRWRPLGHDLFWWALVLLVILTHGTVAQRILRARRFILSR